MASPKRPSLSNLVEPKGKPAEPPSPSASVEAPPVKAASPVDLKTMQVRVNRAGWLEMSRLAQDLDMPLEELMVEAFNDVLAKHRNTTTCLRR